MINLRGPLVQQAGATSGDLPQRPKAFLGAAPAHLALQAFSERHRDCLGLRLTSEERQWGFPPLTGHLV